MTAVCEPSCRSVAGGDNDLGGPGRAIDRRAGDGRLQFAFDVIADREHAAEIRDTGAAEAEAVAAVGIVVIAGKHGDVPAAVPVAGEIHFDRVNRGREIRGILGVENAGGIGGRGDIAGLGRGAGESAAEGAAGQSDRIGLSGGQDSGARSGSR